MILATVGSFFLGKAKWFLIIGIALAAAWGYWMWSQAQIRDLHNQVALVQKQADDLTAANTKIKADVKSVQDAQATASKRISDARVRADQTSQGIRQRNLAAAVKANPTAAENQINADMAATFKSFEDATHAP